MVPALLGPVLLDTRAGSGHQAGNCPGAGGHTLSPMPTSRGNMLRISRKQKVVGAASTGESIPPWCSFADVTCTCRDGFVGDGYWCSGKLPDVLADQDRFSTFYSVSDALLALQVQQGRGRDQLEPGGVGVWSVCKAAHTEGFLSRPGGSWAGEGGGIVLPAMC